MQEAESKPNPPSVKRVCVFCGTTPVDKNNEHVIPQWLMKLTGNPGRIVRFGYDPKKGSPIEFAWKSFQFPACTKCNDDFADFEAQVKSIMEQTLERKDLTIAQCTTLLDWFDKVRIGLWFANYYLLKNPSGINPHLSIKQRIATSDRVLLIYPTTDKSQGITYFGAETPLFQLQPSCFGLRINDLVFINLSSQFLIAKHCGFPYPKRQVFNLDGPNKDKIEFQDFETLRQITTPITKDFNLYHPSVNICQPILIPNPGQRQGKFFGDNNDYDSYLAAHCIDYSKGIGAVFHQENQKTNILLRPEEKIKFSSITTAQSQRTGDIVSQVYDIQYPSNQPR